MADELGSTLRGALDWLKAASLQLKILFTRNVGLEWAKENHKTLRETLRNRSELDGDDFKLIVGLVQEGTKKAGTIMAKKRNPYRRSNIQFELHAT